MATGFGDADRLRDQDFSVSHRPPPPVPSPTAAHLRDFYQSDAPDLPPAAAPAPRAAADRDGDDDSASALDRRPSSSRRRRGSLPSFLRRTPSTASTASRKNDVAEIVPPVPQVPNTRISQAHADAAAQPARQSSKSTLRNKNKDGASSMLRKVSGRAERKEQERRIKEATAAAAAPRQPPSLPDFQPLPSFHEDGDPRPDSVAIFNTAYTHSATANQARSQANFSRPAMAPASTANSSSPAYAARSVNAVPNSSSPSTAPRSNGEYVADPDADRSQSMTNRGRFSIASSVGQVNSVNSPRRVRRRKDPTPFNVLVIGAKNSGKTSLISFLRHSLALPAHKQAQDHPPESQVGGSRSSYKSDYLETEIDGERVGLTLWDSAGLEKNIVDLQLREMTAFVEAKFEDTFMEEQKVMRSPGVRDTHIHCVFLILDPSRLDTTIAESSAFLKYGSHSGSLDEHLDLQVLRALWGKTTVIPVLSKADTLTANHMSFLKRAVWEAIKGANLNPLEALELEEEEEEEDADEDGDSEADSEEGDELPVPKSKKNHKRHSSLSAAASVAADDEMPYLPMSILSPDIYDLPPYAPKSKAAKPDKIGRKFPWGFADPYDPEHCDFGRLRVSVFSEWRTDLRELSRSRWYENWRTSRLQNLPGARQRIKGGVTPVAAVPKEGRSASGARQFSSQPVPSSSVPRSVSLASNTTAATNPPAGMGFAANGEKSRDFSGSQTGSVRGGAAYNRGA